MLKFQQKTEKRLNSSMKISPLEAGHLHVVTH